MFGSFARGSFWECERPLSFRCLALIGPRFLATISSRFDVDVQSKPLLHEFQVLSFDNPQHTTPLFRWRNHFLVHLRYCVLHGLPHTTRDACIVVAVA